MDYNIIVSLLTLIALEVVLGIDNIVFISILAGKLPPEQQKKAQQWGLVLAMLMRLGLLAVISVIIKLEKDLFEIWGNGISGKDIVLILGGLFLLYKSAKELYHKAEHPGVEEAPGKTKTTFRSVLAQILLMDLVFSIDSVITAVGMADELWVMYVAVVVTVAVMLFAAAPVSRFINQHPAFKVLALSFLLLIGTTLIAEGFDMHIPKGYIYFSMAFALLVDVIQLRKDRTTKMKQAADK
jgi:predicted tellurium resistance membrane protein TerC